MAAISLAARPNTLGGPPAGGPVTRALLMLATTGALLSTVASQAQTLVSSDPDTRMAVVELYTSEGCSSCPPADKRLTKIGKREDPNVLPLAFHVDYWDYLGWKDAFSKAQYTSRQRRLGRINRQNTIYTPEFFIDGQEARRSRERRISDAKESQPKADLILKFDDSQADVVKASLAASSIAADSQPQVFFAITENKLVREIKGGENGGRTLNHDHVVRVWAGPFELDDNGSAMQSLKLDPSWQRDNLRIVAIVEDARSGQTLQAVYSPLAKL